MRCICLSFALVVAPMSGAFAQTPKVEVDVGSLLRVPDLSPSLTDAEVRAKFEPWAERVKKVMQGVNADFVGFYAGARAALESRLPRVNKITLYSLFPIDSANLEHGQDRIQKLPLFHDYPILGSVTLENPDEANRWTHFLRDQIIPADFLACDFMPRHGFRLVTANGNVDILMCFACSQFAIVDGKKGDGKDFPSLSPAVKDQVNQLFDKLKIERDLEKKDK